MYMLLLREEKGTQLPLSLCVLLEVEVGSKKLNG